MKPRKSVRTAHNSSGRRKNNTHDSIDRISALPDSILAEILSLLPTKNAFTTSTLSKRWKFLWRAVHNLDFWFGRKTTDTYRVWPAGGFVEGVEKFVPNLDEQVEYKKFVRYVNHVLLHHDAPVLNMFRLVCKPSCIESHVTSWIKTAITKNVHELSVTLESYYDAPIDVPISVFGCGSLRSLKLKGWFYLSGATVFCLPRLETLDLHGVTFECDEIFEKMIRGCRVLNYLHIDMNDQGDDSRFIISSTSLRRLELINSGSHKYLKLEASSLEHLKLFGYISVNFVQEKLRSLVEAEVGIYLDYDDFSQAGICNSVVDAVSALNCAKNLTLSDRVMRALSRATINLSTGFERLVKLETTIGCRHWSSLQDFIQRSNNLEILTIRKFLDDGNDHDHSNWTTPVEVPRCLSTSLKKVELYSYYGDEDGREMIRYMLKHGSVLEVMQIFCYTDKNRKTFELLQEICEFPRQSPSCEVKFSGWKSKSKVKAL